MSLAPGATLGRYQILEPLGGGGMATVYRAFQPALDRVVALKVMRADLAADAEFVARFRREAKAIARLRHPHIVDVFDFDQESGRYFLAMEYLDGGTLKAKLADLAAAGQRLPSREVVRVVSEAADALQFAHASGVVHRDVKPSNIMLTGDGRVVVTDFGIAKILAATQYTQTGVGIGTPEYMSPEQCQGVAVDHRSDIYSLGILAYELLTGAVPFTADTPLATALKQIRDPLPLPSTRASGVGPATERVLLRALAKRAEDRYGAAPELATALERAIADDARETAATVAVPRQALRSPEAMPAVAATRVLRLPSAPRSWLLAAGSAGLLLLLGAGAILGFYGRPQPAPSPSGPPAGAPAATLLAQPSPTPTPTPTPLAAAPGILGTVMNGPIGRPLLNAVVVAFAGGTTPCCIVVATATTNASGSYAISLPAGTYRVSFRPPRDAGLGSHWWHAAPGQIALTFQTASDVTVSGMVRGIDAALLPGYSIGGRVTDASGAGIRDANVFAVQSDTSNYVVGGTTDGSGTYSLSVPKTNDGYRIGFRRTTAPGPTEQWWNGVADLRAATTVIVPDANVGGINARLGP